MSNSHGLSPVSSGFFPQSPLLDLLSYLRFDAGDPGASMHISLQMTSSRLWLCFLSLWWWPKMLPLTVRLEQVPTHHPHLKSNAHSTFSRTQTPVLDPSCVFLTGISNQWLQSKNPGDSFDSFFLYTLICSPVVSFYFVLLFSWGLTMSTRGWPWTQIFLSWSPEYWGYSTCYQAQLWQVLLYIPPNTYVIWFLPHPHVTMSTTSST